MVSRQSPPLVTVITPTWQRHETLLKRCVPSVAAQDYPRVEHIVVSDGPDPFLRQFLADTAVRYLELDDHPAESFWGHHSRLLGIAHATGDYIAYLDDDNSYRPQHLTRLADDLDNHTVAGFTYSQMLYHDTGGVSRHVLGSPPPRLGQIDTSIIMHRRTILDVATWEPSWPTVDWDLVERWMINGVEWSYVDEVTVDYYK